MWLLITSIVINIIILIIGPRRLTLKEIYICWWTITLLAIFTDQSLGGVHRLYNYGKPGVDMQGMIIHLFHEPLFGLVFLNFMPEDKLKFMRYTLFWVIFSTFYEWLITLTGFLKNIVWETYYSIPIYIIVFLFLRFHLKFIRR